MSDHIRGAVPFVNSDKISLLFVYYILDSSELSQNVHRKDFWQNLQLNSLLLSSRPHAWNVARIRRVARCRCPLWHHSGFGFKIERARGGRLTDRDTSSYILHHVSHLISGKANKTRTERRKRGRRGETSGSDADGRGCGGGGGGARPWSLPHLSCSSQLPPSPRGSLANSVHWPGKLEQLAEVSAAPDRWEPERPADGGTQPLSHQARDKGN